MLAVLTSSHIHSLSEAQATALGLCFLQSLRWPHVNKAFPAVGEIPYHSLVILEESEASTVPVCTPKY